MVVSALASKLTAETTLTCTESRFWHPLSLRITKYQVSVVGLTVGVAVLPLTILVLGVQLNTPVPLAFKVTASGTQINVSLKPSPMTGLSSTLIFMVAVSMHPLLLVTINVTVFG